LTRWTSLALAGVLLAIGGVVVAVAHLIQRDRAELVERFSEERLAQLDEAAGEIEEDFDDITDDLRFAGQLVQAADSAGDREREIHALLAVVKHYRLVEVFDRDGNRVLSVTDPVPGRPTAPAEFAADIAATARRALARDAGEVETSTALAADPGGWYRVFATALPARGGAIAVLVDTEPLFAKLRLVLSTQGSQLLVLGAHGRPAPVSDPSLARAFGDLDADPAVHPTLGRLVDAMDGARRGTLSIGEREAAELGLGREVAIAAHTPIAIRGGGHWSAATLTSTTELRAPQRGLLLRLGLGAGAVVLCLVGFGTYVVVTARRAVAVREQLRHAERLAHLHEKAEKVLDNVPAAVLVLAADGRITAINRALRDRVADSVVGAPMAAAFPEAPPAVITRLAGLVDRARAGDKVHSLVGEHLALFGEEGQYTVHAVPLEPRFDEARAFLVIDDVSEVRSLESQLVRAEKLATVGVLAAGIAHEIGTPLGVVRARAEYLHGKLGPDHALAEGTRVIVEQIDRVSRTIRELLDFARVRPASVQQVRVAQVARAATELLGFAAERARIDLDIDIPDDLVVAADPDQLQQVVVNLVLNACDACAAGGKVRIGATAHHDPDTSWDGVRITVEDDGCGIPAELRLRVFDPFYTTKKRGRGTGLGLSIAAQLVRNHGGSIDLDSEPGRGTRVTVSWPRPGAGEERQHEQAI